MNTLDIIIILVIIAITITLVIINVNSLLNNKLSNIAVNIPPISIPEPQITVQVQKSCTSNEYDVYIQKVGGTSDMQKVALSPVQLNDKNEHFTQQPVIQETVTKINNIDGNNSFEKTDKSSPKNVEIPNESNLIPSKEQDPSKVTEQIIDKKEKKEISKNISLENRRQDAYKYISQNSKPINNYEFPMCNTGPTIVNTQLENNFLSNTNDYAPVTTPSDLNNDDEDEDILISYRKKQQYVKSYLEDPVVRGYNVDGFESSAALEQIGKIPLNKIVNNPKPSGYIFDFSPVFTR